MTTGVPTGPLGGLKLVIWGVTRNCLLLVNVPPGVVTVTGPVRAPAGTVTVKYVSEDTVKAEGVPPNETPDVPVKPWPRISTVLPTLPAFVSVLTKGVAPMFRLKMTPQFPLQPTLPVPPN